MKTDEKRLNRSKITAAILFGLLPGFLLTMFVIDSDSGNWQALLFGLSGLCLFVVALPERYRSQKSFIVFIYLGFMLGTTSASLLGGLN